MRRQRDRGDCLLAASDGLLTGAYDRERVWSLPEDDRRADIYADFLEPRLSPTLALIDRLRPIAARLEISLTTLAIAWALAVPGVTGAIVGGLCADQVTDWLAASALDLEPEVLSEIDLAIAETRAGDDLPPPTTL